MQKLIPKNIKPIKSLIALKLANVSQLLNVTNLRSCKDLNKSSKTNSFNLTKNINITCINRTFSIKEKTSITSLLVSLLLVTSNLSLASQSNNSNEPDPCGAVLCLSGVQALNGNLGECKPHIKKFFSFNAFSKKGFFNPNASYVKRYKWLNECKEANPAFKQAIMAQYGYMQKSPF